MASQPDLFAPPAERPAWTGDLRRASEIASRWREDFSGHSDAGRTHASVPVTEIGTVAAAVLRLASPAPDGTDAADPIAFLEAWLDGGKDGAVAPMLLTPGQGRRLLDGIRARLAVAVIRDGAR